MDLERLPLDAVHAVRDTCLCLHTQRAARMLARRFDIAFACVGLTNGQFSLMMSLCRPNPPTVGQAASLLAMDRTTMTAAVKALERQGLVKIQVDREDRRQRRLMLTVKGAKKLRAAWPVWQAEHKKLEQELPPTIVPALLRAQLKMFA